MHGLTEQHGRDLLIGTACAVVAPLLGAAAAGLLGRRRAALVWAGVAVAALLALGLSGVASPDRLRTATHAVLHPPPHEPGTRPDRMGICSPHPGGS